MSNFALTAFIYSFLSLFLSSLSYSAPLAPTLRAEPDSFFPRSVAASLSNPQRWLISAHRSRPKVVCRFEVGVASALPFRCRDCSRQPRTPTPTPSTRFWLDPRPTCDGLACAWLVSTPFGGASLRHDRRRRGVVSTQRWSVERHYDTTEGVVEWWCLLEKKFCWLCWVGVG